MFRFGLLSVLLCSGLALAQTAQPGAPNQAQSNSPVPLPVPTELADLSMSPPAFIPNVQDADAPRAEPVRVVRISGGVMAGQVASHVDPVYPPDAKASHVQGSVVLDALIGTDGAVRTLKVVSGPAQLADAATAAVHQWTYRPFKVNGRPVEVRTTVTVNFHLNPPEPSPQQ